jgi:hypothetical protein
LPDTEPHLISPEIVCISPLTSLHSISPLVDFIYPPTFPHSIFPLVACKLLIIPLTVIFSQQSTEISPALPSTLIFIILASGVTSTPSMITLFLFIII